MKLDALLQKQIDVSDDEIHYEHEGYNGHGEKERANVVAEYISFENEHRLLAWKESTAGRFIITNNCFIDK